MPVKFRYDPKSPLAPDPGGDAAAAVPDGDAEVPEILFEYLGWGLYTIAHPSDFGNEANTLTHIGCDCEFPNWHLAAYLWQDYRPEGDTRFVCTECREIMPTEAYKMFCKVHKLLNKS